MEEHENTLVRSENKAKPRREEKIIAGSGSEAQRTMESVCLFFPHSQLIILLPPCFFYIESEFMVMITLDLLLLKVSLRNII